MPRFSQESFSKLSTCHIDLQVLFFEVVKTFDCVILEGYRNEQDQEAAFNRGATTLHYPHGKHNHQPSLAVDVAPYPIDWKNTKQFIFFGGFVLGIAEQLFVREKITHKIRWGGDFNMNHNPGDDKFFDGVHFEIIK